VGRGHKRECCGNYFVAGFQTQCHHRHLQRICAVSTRNNVFNIEVFFQVFLKSLNSRAIDKCTGVYDFLNAFIYFGFDINFWVQRYEKKMTYKRKKNAFFENHFLKKRAKFYFEVPANIFLILK